MKRPIYRDPWLGFAWSDPHPSARSGGERLTASIHRPNFSGGAARTPLVGADAWEQFHVRLSAT
jgi:hypothetical protein